MKIKNRIKIPSLRIVGENDFFYEVIYNGEAILVAKARECANFTRPPVSSFSIEMQMRQEILIPESDILQDVTVPNEFKGVTIFHELREKEYRDGGIKDAHERAVNDEILFVLRNLTSTQGERYFRFADEYRKIFVQTQKEREKQRRLQEEFNRLKKICDEEQSGPYHKVWLGLRSLLNSYQKVFLISTNDETASRLEELTSQPSSQIWRDNLFSYRGVLKEGELFDLVTGCQETIKSFGRNYLNIFLTGNQGLEEEAKRRGIDVVHYSPLDDKKPYIVLREILDSSQKK